MIIDKRYNRYQRIDGTVIGWERGDEGQGHQVTITSDGEDLTHFAWRAPEDPTAGDQLTVVLPHEGISAKQNRPLMIMNHTTGSFHREQNAPDPSGTRSIMVKLALWVAIAMVISGAIIIHTTGLTMLTLQLLAAAIIVWRLAIATSDLRADEKMTHRKEDEDRTCLEVIAGQWQETPQARKPRVDISTLLPPRETAE